MNNDDWKIERWRLMLVAFIAIIGGALSGHWLISLVFALVGYIGWSLYKLNQLHTWLNKGAKPSLLPDSNGLWERITQQVQVTHKKSDRRKERMANLLKLQQGIMIQIISVEKGLKLLIARDISERINIHRMRKNFIANASHELRTPLTVIAGYLEIMQGDENFPENLKLAVNSASDQSIRMQRIIEDLLTLSRLENSELNDNSHNIINVPSVLERICADETSLITNDTHVISNDIDNNLKLKGSDAEIISVCSNLVHNAVRHTQDGTHVSVKWELTQDKEARLSIIDNGQGIPAEHLAHLTERFYRVDKGRSRDKGGTGLGLAIVQHIVQRHGGQLIINSNVGLGSEFIVTFPEHRVVVD